MSAAEGQLAEGRQGGAGARGKPFYDLPAVVRLLNVRGRYWTFGWSYSQSSLWSFDETMLRELFHLKHTLQLKLEHRDDDDATMINVYALSAPQIEKPHDRRVSTSLGSLVGTYLARRRLFAVGCVDQKYS